ncbi:MAG: DUF6020 family protein [Lachnospiraceae bacterium]|nr:DUF6020 family protein [Butyrivibrio sp.]MCM1343543.1 DUF6020 family protein [Muribaculaceae bacterium]MCM1410594.1 DUF6020 family protein [Lachnospiraceae bacterium]
MKLGRKCIFSAIVGIAAAFCYVAGYRLDTFDSLDLLDRRFYFLWGAASVAAAVVVYLLWMALDRIAARPHGKETGAVKASAKGHFTCAALLFLCWLPALMSLFPGAFSYDAFDEWEQVHQWMITSHHPVIHVLFLGGLLEGFFRLTGDYNVGIAVYSVVQMLILANVFASTIDFMKEFGVPRIYRGASVLFYALSPVAQLFSICATKDVLFTGAELLFFLYTVRFAVDRKMPGDGKKMICFAISALFTMILRNNGVYIVLLTLLALAVISHRELRQYKGNWTVFLLVILVPYLLYTGPVCKILDVKPGGVEEMLSVPLQQMARVYRYEYDSLSEEDRELLCRYVEQDALEEYRPTVADFVKSGFHREAFEQDRAGFLKLWARWGAAHPLTYINSFLINTVDAWYPHALIDGYRHGDGRGSYFDYQVDAPGREVVYLPALHERYETLSHDLQAQQKPLAFLALSPGWYFWCTMLFFFYFWSRGKYRMMMPFLVFLFHFLTVLMGPMILVRYLLIFFFAFPAVAGMAVYGKGTAADETCK